MIALPPLFAGATKATLTCALPRVATTPVGAFGTVAGVTLLELAEAAPSPTSLTALTAQVTGVPLVRPLTTSGEAGPVWLALPQVASATPIDATHWRVRLHPQIATSAFATAVVERGFGLEELRVESRALEQTFLAIAATDTPAQAA